MTSKKTGQGRSRTGAVVVAMVVLFALPVLANFGLFTPRRQGISVLQIFSDKRGFTAFGDSITAGVGASSESNAWPALLAMEKRWALTNRAVGGFKCPDAAAAIYRRRVDSNAVFTLMIGTGESIHDPDRVDAYQHWHLPEVAWLAIPAKKKVAGTNPSVRYEGDWGEYADFAIGRAGKGIGSSATISGLEGTAILLCYARKSEEFRNKGAFELSVDGRPWGGVYPTSLGFNFESHPTILKKAVPWYLLVTNLPPGQHNLTLTVVTNEGTVELDWAAGLSEVPAKGMPRVFVGNIPPQTRMNTSSKDCNERVISAMNERVAQNCATLKALGLNVTLVDVSDALNRESDFDDFCHPNDRGYQKLKAVFLQAMEAAGL